MVEGVWSGFTGLDVCRKDGTPLTYYKSYLTQNTSLDNLLSETDGQCSSWAEFLQNTLLVHGSPGYFVEISPITAEGFLVEKWTFHEPPSFPESSFPYENRVYSYHFLSPLFFIYETGYLWNGTPDVSYTAGTPGQNNLKPAALFNLHYVVTIGNILYDPSYGKVYQSLQDVDNAFSGFLKFTPLSCMIQQNPPGIQISVRMIQ